MKPTTAPKRARCAEMRTSGRFEAFTGIPTAGDIVQSFDR